MPEDEGVAGITQEMMSPEDEGMTEITLSPEENVPSHDQNKEDSDPKTRPPFSSSSFPKASSLFPAEGDGEAQDVLSDLPPSPLVKGRRQRSETESRNSKGSLLSFKGRKRSHTLQEGDVVRNKEEQEASVQWELSKLVDFAGSEIP